MRVSDGSSPGSGRGEDFHMVGNPNGPLRLNTVQYPPANTHPIIRVWLGHDEWTSLSITEDIPLSFNSFVAIRGKPIVSEYERKIRFMTPAYVDNEYAQSFIHINMESITNTQIISQTLQPKNQTFNDVVQSFYGVACKSTPVPLNLTLTPDVISFGAITLGDTVPTTRELRWTTTGSGKANIWSVRFESSNIVNNKLTLGGATVSITGKNDQEIPVNTDIAIEGTSGTFNFHLDPSNGTINDHETAVNVVLTAN